jgi:hypothetical protein
MTELDRKFFLFVIPQNKVETISDIEKRVNLRLPLLILWYCYKDFQICRFILMMHSRVDASFVEPEANTIFGALFKKKNRSTKL